MATDQLTSGNGSDNVDSEKGLEEPAQTIAEGRTASTASVKKEAPASKPAAAEPAAKVATGTAKRKRSSEKQPTKGKGRSTPLEKKSKAQSAEQGGNKKSKPSEKERKAQLAKKLIIRKTHPPLLTKYASKPSKDLDAKASNVEAGKSSSLSAVAGWKSLAGALGPGASKKQAPIERSEATKLEILRKILTMIIRQMLIRSSNQGRAATGAKSGIWAREGVIQVNLNLKRFVRLLILIQSRCLSTSGPKVSGVQLRPLSSKDHAGRRL